MNSFLYRGASFATRMRDRLTSMLAGAGWRSMRLAFIVSVLLLVGLIWWLVWQRVQAERDQLEASAVQQQASLAAVVAEGLAQAVSKGQLIALAASVGLVEKWHEKRSVEEAQQRLSSMLSAENSLFARYLLLDADLQPLDSDAYLPGELAALVTALHRDKAQLAGLPYQKVPVRLLQRLDATSQKRTDHQQLPLIYPLGPVAPGAAGGYLLLMLDLGDFLNLYRNVDMSAGSNIHLLDADGYLLAQLNAQGMQSPPIGTRLLSAEQLREHSGFAQVAEQPAAPPSRWNWQRNPHAPFIALVSSGSEAQSAAHNEDRRKVWTLLGLVTVCVLLAVAGMLRMLRHQERLFTALSEASRDKHLLIEQLQEEKSKALEWASNDHLTGLHNRRMFNELVASHLAMARRSRKFYALIYLDLDRFKAINDTLGHHVGDLLLQAVAQRLRLLLRSSDIIARMGGDEFAVLVTGMEAMEDMDALAANLVARLSEPYEGIEGQRLEVTPSLGVAFFPRDGHDVKMLCRHADAAMYASKRAGRGCFTYYDATGNTDSMRSYALERQLHKAIADGEMVLHFQPKVDLQSYRITGFEALVRWQHPEFGLVYPGEFIASAEATGTIRALGDWVIQACCQQIEAWRKQGLEPLPIAFNVSALQLRDETFAQRLQAQMRRHGVQPSELAMEITESCLIEPRAQALSVLEQVQALGVSIGLDDFGTGFSSLSQIKDLPINTLKLDRSFVNDIRSNSGAGVIVTSIITLAHNLKMRVVAEGVELMDQLVYLKTAGCDEAQGYFLSRPVASDAAEQLLRGAFLYRT